MGHFRSQKVRESSDQCSAIVPTELWSSVILLCKACIKTCLKLIALKYNHSYIRNIKNGKEKNKVHSGKFKNSRPYTVV